MKNGNKIKMGLLAGISLVAMIIVFSLDPVCQDKSYHVFADARELFSVPNFWNTLSNLPFLFIGIAGMFYVTGKKPTGILNKFKMAYFIFFAGIFFTGIGSAYYHFGPTNKTLVWDRLPMTIAFMSFFALIIAEYISEKVGKWVLCPLMIIGFISVYYWSYTEEQGCGDLRMYALVQFLPMLLVPLIMLLFQPKFTKQKYLWFMLIAYVIAKLFEAGDDVVYTWGHLISGHSIKHIFAASAPLIFLMGIKCRDLK